ncbi:MAG: hypothetical protein IIB33_05130 [Chloroflexi bacterium]|nr:hypothetical protein [Chloroflexota bacterium]
MTASETLETVSQRLGEVVETSSTAFTVHCYRLYEAAPLGALVRAGNENTVYAVVSNVATLPLDPGRRPVPRGQDEDDEEAVYLSNPQLPRLLRTEFQAVIVGHKDGDSYRYYLPAQPPRIHAFVEACQANEVREFVQRLDFLPLLLAGAGPAGDEVAAAFLRQAALAQEDAEAFLVSAGRQVARFLSRDLQRLDILLGRMHP